MKSPNFLILDEPTNDLDIVSLNVLEEYLLAFPGSLIIVSHDRYFLDKLADHIFVFEGDGLIKDYVGKYSEYREMVKELEAAKERELIKTKEPAIIKNNDEKKTAGKLSWKEQRELEEIDEKLDALEKEKSSLEAALSSGSLSPEELTKYSLRIGEVISNIDRLSDRWLELTP
ncbi:ABC transporter ATP-binding protein uup [bioreactor metagenome]|jgi:ATP-binding cassette subfamily F protein uup|uniref:ABC transporter ATP-binding protein uup n=1 Tax=bioreactor metagenome TaxID=1076179 RepID=A0A645G4A5_9ZZZZ